MSKRRMARVVPQIVKDSNGPVMKKVGYRTYRKQQCANPRCGKMYYRQMGGRDMENPFCDECYLAFKERQAQAVGERKKRRGVVCHAAV